MVWTRAPQIWKLRVEDQPSRRLSPLVQKRKSLIWKLLTTNVRPSGQQCLTVLTRLSNRKDFQRKSQKFWSYNCLSVWLRFTIWTTSIHITAVAHLNHQPINRGPWALRTARIRYWIPLELRKLSCEVIGADLFYLKPLRVYCCCATIEVYLMSWP
jgi:hypothetical protein